MPGVEVVLTPGPRTVLTAAGGTFHFADLAPGAYNGRIRRIGYLPLTFRIAIRSGATDSLNFQLNRLTASLAPVFVSAQAPSVRLAAVMNRQTRRLGSVLYAEDFARKGYQDVAQVIADPAMQRRLLGSFFTGGSCPARVYLDGRPFPFRVNRSVAAELGVPGMDPRQTDQQLISELMNAVPLEDIEAVEAHSSMDFIKTAVDYDTYSLNRATGSGRAGGSGSVGSVAAMRGGGNCIRLIMVWTRNGKP